MNDQNQSYKLTPEHISNLYNQEYLRDAIKCEKFKSLDGALQRAVIEEALIETEAMKLFILANIPNTTLTKQQQILKDLEIRILAFYQPTS